MNWLVVMAGGYGERFWPMSRRNRPKQLLPIVGKRTMIQETVARLRPLFPPSRILVVTNREQAALVRKQLPKVAHIIAEPVGRNTAPCVALAAAFVGKRDPEAVMAVVPADSYIGDAKRYREVVAESLALARDREALITVGIPPTSPHTGYGYIQVGEPLADGYWKAKRFVEKPDGATAERFVASGEYRWNAGMFVWSLRTIREAFQRHQPAMWAQIGRITGGLSLQRIYSKLEKISVDYAIMEKADNVVVANGDFDWDDVGDWQALERHFARDADGNIVRGDFVSLDAKGCITVAGKNHLIAAIGVRDLVIVRTSDATLVCHKSEAQKVRELVRRLASQRGHRKLL